MPNLPAHPTRRWLRLWLLAMACVAGLAQAQPMPAPGGPWRTSSDAQGANLMLEGHDAVAYFTQNDAVKGDAAITLQLHGVTWRFATEANRSEFQRAPDKYLPQFGGYCSNGINYAIPWGGGGGPHTWRIYRGRLYVFGGQASRDHFEMDTERNLALAHKYWNEEVAGSWAFGQRVKRLLLRVPHYQTGRQLDDAYRERLAARTLPVMPGAPQVVPRD
jgi:YHS domain-containing protein